jgi:hypothetical protein
VNPKGLAPKIPGAAKTQKKLYLNDDLRQGLRNCPKLIIIFSINIIILQDEFSPELCKNLSPPPELFENPSFPSLKTHLHPNPQTHNLCLLIISLHSPSSSAENSLHPPEC